MLGIDKRKAQTAPFSKIEEAVYRSLRLGHDTPIADIYCAAFPDGKADTSSDKMRCLGPYVARINKKCDCERIVTGSARRSYRLEAIKD